MFHFFIFVLSFVVLMTLVARYSGIPVRQYIPDATATTLTTAFVAIVMVCWWFVTKGDMIEDRILAPLILPSPMEVLNAFPVLHSQQGLVRSVGVSFVRVTTGFTLAAILALTLGVYMASFPPVSAFFKPLALASSYVPIIVFIPLTLSWWGANEMQKIGFLFIACFVALLPLIIKDINDVSSAYLDVAMTKGANQWQLVRYVLFPVALPNIWDHMRGVYGVGWGWIIMAEIVNGQAGIGYLMSISDRRGHTSSTFAIIIVIVTIAVISDQIWKQMGYVLFKYRNR